MKIVMVATNRLDQLYTCVSICGGEEANYTTPGVILVGTGLKILEHDL